MITGDLAREQRTSEAMLYSWQSKFGGINVSDAKRLRASEEENGKLKRLMVDAMLDASVLR